MENHKFWFECMRRITFEFPRNVKRAVIQYTYTDENGEEQQGTKVIDLADDDDEKGRRTSDEQPE